MFEQTDDIKSWRNKDFSGVEEMYLLRPYKTGSNYAYVFYLLFAIPLMVMLIGIPLALITRGHMKGKIGSAMTAVTHILVFVFLGYMAVLGSAGSLNALLAMAPLLLVGLAVMTLLSLKAGKIGAKQRELERKNIPKIAGDESVPDYLVGSKVFGQAGNLKDARGKFSDANIDKGEAGEKLTASLLNDLLRIPGTRIFHGVEWPGTKAADIDHIVVNGSKVALVDSKMWSGKKHIITSKGHIVTYSGNNESYGRDLRFPFAVKHLSSALRHKAGTKATCYGWLAIHNPNGRRPAVDNKYNPGLPVHLASADDAVNQIGAWLAAEADGVVDVELMDNLLNRVKQ